MNKLNKFGIPVPIRLPEIPPFPDKSLPLSLLLSYSLGGPFLIHPPPPAPPQSNPHGRLEGVFLPRDHSAQALLDLRAISSFHKKRCSQEGLPSLGPGLPCVGWQQRQREIQPRCCVLRVGRGPRSLFPLTWAWCLPGGPEELSNNSGAPALWNLLPGNRETGTCIPGERNQFPAQTKQ